MNGYIRPVSIEERLMHVKEAERTLGSEIPWICDLMSNDMKHAFGGAPNSEFIIDPEGKVAVRRSWSRPDELREDLERLVGAVANPTQVEDLEPVLREDSSNDEIAVGVLPRLELPGGMTPLKVRPNRKEGDPPYYAKLRVEADQAFMDGGEGQLYLGFRLDPLYKVHWNNLTEPLEFGLTNPEWVITSVKKGRAPKLEETADKDPREFLMNIVAADRSEPLELTVRYFACDDANTFCVPVTQKYEILLTRDPDGGRRTQRGGRGGRRGNGGPPARGGGNFGSPRGPGGGGVPFLARLMENDQNQDGRISQDEAPERMSDRFDFMDADGDGFVDREEIQGMRDRFRQRGGLGGNRGSRNRQLR